MVPCPHICQLSTFKGLSTTFEGSSNVSYMLTYVTIGVNTCTYRLQHAYEVQIFNINIMRYSFLLGDSHKFTTNVRDKDHKSPKYIILLPSINIRILYLTFECCNIQRFIRM